MQEIVEGVSGKSERKIVVRGYGREESISVGTSSRKVLYMYKLNALHMLLVVLADYIQASYLSDISTSFRPAPMYVADCFHAVPSLITRCLKWLRGSQRHFL